MLEVHHKMKGSGKSGGVYWRGVTLIEATFVIL
jgi:hypothetical protein